jgi:uncharacterized protein (DUF1330 family)
MPRTLCVLLWAQPGGQAALTAYEDRVLRLVPDHGGRVVHRARNSGVQRGGGGGPDGQPAEIQFLDFPSQAALDAYMADPRRTALAADRDRAVARTEIIDVELDPLPPPA